MKYIIDFINTYGISIIHSIAITIISLTSLEIKKYIKDKTKKEVITMVINTVNKLYSNINNEQKLNIIITNSKEVLKEKGITINNLELRMYIENIGSDTL